MDPLTALGLEATWLRILVIVLLVALAHFIISWLRGLIRSVLERPRGAGEAVRESWARRYPTAATLVTLVASALLFLVYMVGLGWILAQFGASLTTYLATASVLGLAIAFGSQGLVQDMVIGLTLLFTDILDVGDMVEVSGQIGRVDSLGLRFTTLVNFQGQRVYVPNRNITLVGRYRRGALRAYVDVLVPPEVDAESVREAVRRVADAVRRQLSAIVLSPPEELGLSQPDDTGFRYIRTKLRLWPGQQAAVEAAFRQRALHALRALDPSYADWMITITYRTPAERT